MCKNIIEKKKSYNDDNDPKFIGQFKKKKKEGHNFQPMNWIGGRILKIIIKWSLFSIVGMGLYVNGFFIFYASPFNSLNLAHH